jgi:hypothetical protein
MNLSEHFTLEEMIASQTASRLGINNIPSISQIERLKRVAGVMEEVRKVLGNKPIFISSGYRNPQVNAAVGGAINSAHVNALACDFTCPSFGPPPLICSALAPYIELFSIDQLINEYPPHGWVHLGLSDNVPRMMVFTIDANGTRTGIV